MNTTWLSTGPRALKISRSARSAGPEIGERQGVILSAVAESVQAAELTLDAIKSVCRPGRDAKGWAGFLPVVRDESLEDFLVTAATRVTLPARLTTRGFSVLNQVARSIAPKPEAAGEVPWCMGTFMGYVTRHGVDFT